MLMKPFRFIGRFFVDQWVQFTPAGQMLFVFALVAIVVDAGIAYEYGITMSALHAAGFALVALGLAFLPEEAWKAAERKDYTTAGMLGALSIFILMPVAYQTHVGYGAGIRTGDMQQTGFHNARLEGAQTLRDNSQASLKTFVEQRKILVEERESVKASNPWVTTTTATALREEVNILDGRIADETAGKRGRAKGCKTVCEQLQDEKRGVLAKLSSIERLEGVTARLAELDKSIAATQRVIDEKTEKVAAVGYKSSTVVNQNTALGDLWHLVTGKEAPAQIVSLATMGTSSLAFLFMAPAFMIAAGRNRRKGVAVSDESGRSYPVSTVITDINPPRTADLPAPVALMAPVPSPVSRETYVINDDKAAQIKQAIMRALNPKHAAA